MIIYYWNAMTWDRVNRYVPQQYDALYDVFEQKMQWRGQVLTLIFAAGGDWELSLHVPGGGGTVVVAYGHIANEDVDIRGQNIPDFRVVDLSQLVARIRTQIRLREEYRHHLS